MNYLNPSSYLDPDPSEQPTAEFAAIDPLAGIYVDGHARAEAIPIDSPILTGGAAHGAVTGLVQVLNRELGLQLPYGDIVTTEVIAGVRALRAKHGFPIEKFGYHDEPNAIGPNTWAAVHALAGAAA